MVYKSKSKQHLVSMKFDMYIKNIKKKKCNTMVRFLKY